MPITTPAAFTAPSLRRPRGVPLLAAGIAWLSRIGGAALRLRTPRPDPSLTVAFGGAPRAMDLAFSPRSFASGWLDLRS